jgi:hypothetical protein
LGPIPNPQSPIPKEIIFDTLNCISHMYVHINKYIKFYKLKMDKYYHFSQTEMVSTF